jgi:Homeodomain-like domain
MTGLVDKPSTPEHCPHQMTPIVEARIVELRRTHPAWGPRTIRTHLGNEGVTPLPGPSSIYGALIRHRAPDDQPPRIRTPPLTIFPDSSPQLIVSASVAPADRHTERPERPKETVSVSWRAMATPARVSVAWV